jgi:4-hydroxy-tetrahydrodipicolinate synthase
MPTKGRKFAGCTVALVTPFRDGAVDEPGLRRLVEWQIEQGTPVLSPVGTTGESPTLSHEEHERVIAMVVEAVAGRAKVMAGTGSNSTAEAVELSIQAEKAGADAVLVVTPYYNRPTQDGLYRHYKAVNDALAIPIIIYNIPGRSAVDMSVDTMKRLFALGNITGVKDATANVTRVSLQRQALGPWFNQLSGEDASALGFMAHGGHGCISATANIAPRMCAEFQHACLRRDFTSALGLHDRLMPLHTALFLETSPAPVKYALSVLGKCRENLRLPLVSVTESTRLVVRDAMVCAGLMN